MENSIQLTSNILTDEEKRLICAWRYSGLYAVYNMPPYELLAQHQLSFLDPRKENNFRAFYDGSTFLGFVNIKEEPQEVCIAIGICPNLCGKGYGRRMLQEACSIAETLYPGKPLYLEVRTWNERAIRCYQSVGFQIVGKPYEMKTGSGWDTFYRMTRT